MCFLACSLLLHRLCRHIAAYLGVLHPTVDQWNSVSPLTMRVCLLACAQDKQNMNPLIVKQSHSTAGGLKLTSVSLQLSASGQLWEEAFRSFT